MTTLADSKIAGKFRCVNGDHDYEWFGRVGYRRDRCSGDPENQNFEEWRCVGCGALWR